MKTIKLKTLLKQNYGYILLIIFLATISVLSFTPGKYTLSNDNYSPELNPSMTVERTLLSPAWRTYRVLGFGSESEQADIFRAGMFGVFETFLLNSSLGQLYYLLCLFVGSIFMAKLAGSIARDYKGLRRYHQIVVLLAGVGYVTTLWTVWVFYQNMGPYVTNFGFLPLLLYSLYRFIDFSSPKKALFLLLSSLLFTATSVIATVFLVDIIFIFMFILFFSVVKGKVFRLIFKKVVYASLIILVTQLFWILPFVHYTLTTSQDLVDSFVNRSITTSVLDLETQMQDPVNSARLYSRILTDSGGLDVLFGMGEDYLIYDFYKVFGLFPAIFTLLLIPFSIFKKKYALLFFPLLAIGSWFFIKVDNPPLGFVFTWFQEYIPLFKQVFRWPISKLGNILLINLTIGLSFGFLLFVTFLSSFFKNKIVKNVIIFLPVLSLLIIQMFYAEFLFTGKLFSPVSLLEVPQEYYILGEYLEENDSEGRIYYAPASNNNYFRQYEWGFWGSQFISYIIPNPVMDLALAVGSDSGENALLDMANVFRSGDSEKFLSLLQRYEAEYVLVDESITAQGFSFDIDWDIANTLWEDFNLVWQEGHLSLYRVPFSLDRSFVESATKIPSLLDYDNYFVRDIAQYPSIYPLGLGSGEYKIDANDILISFEHRGNTHQYMLSVGFFTSRHLPTRVSRVEDTIVLTPSYPYLDIEGIEERYPFREYELDQEYEYYVLENYTLPRADVLSGTSLSTQYRNSNNIYGLNSDDFMSSIDLLPLLSQSQGDDCSGIQDLNYEVNILDEGIASGISLRGDAKLPCVYTQVPIETERDYVAKVRINWEEQDDILAGFCLYSGNKGQCLNEERYVYSKEPFGDLEFLIREKISAEDNISVVLYALDSKYRGVSNLVFRDVTISWAPLRNSLELTQEEFGGIEKRVLLRQNETYDVRIPILHGENTYSYISEQKPSLIWQPNTENVEFGEISWDNGMYQEVKSGFLNQSNTLFSTHPESKYLVYLEGENFSNIPANVCVLYSGENKCWYQDIFIDQGRYANLSFFNPNNTFTNSLDVLFNSHSYNNLSRNKLNNFILMALPMYWNDIEYIPVERDVYVEYEMDSVSSSPHSTFYSIDQLDVGHGNRIVSIPQARASGWLALIRSDSGYSFLTNENRVTINGWKQAWDITNLDFNSIYVIYWPNLLGYLGYSLIVLQLGIIVTILFKQRIHFKYGKK